MSSELLNGRARNGRQVPFSNLEGPSDLVTKARQEMALRPAIVTGVLSNTADGGRALTIDHLFFEVVESETCSADSDCIHTKYHTLVNSRRDCYCPVCDTFAMNVAAARANEAAYNRFCSRYHDQECHMQFLCIHVPPATCDAGRCCCSSA